MGQALICDSSRLIHERAHDTPFLGETVAGEVEAALAWRVVLGVDVVPCPRVGEAGDVADLVGPDRRLGDVLVVEERGDERRGVGREVLFCQVGDCAVAKRAPGIGGRNEA